MLRENTRCFSKTGRWCSVIIPGADVPLHVQFKSMIRAQVRSGQLQPNEALPGERQFVQTYGLSRTTIRHALNELVAEGVLYRRHGKGTFVSPQKLEQNLTWLKGFAEELQEQGLSVEVRILVAEMRQAPSEVAGKLHLGPGEQVAFVKRLVSVNEMPLFVDRTYVVPQIGSLLLGTDLANEPIYVIVERLGYPIREGSQTISAIQLSAADAQLLEVRTHDPALAIRRITYVEHDAPIEYAEAFYRADRYQYHTRLQRRRADANH